MKKLFTVALMGFLFFLNCSSDDNDNNDTTNVEVVGTWLLTNLSVESTNDYNGDGTANPNLLEETQCSLGDQLIFLSDGTGTIALDSENIHLDAEQISGSSDFEYTFTCTATGTNQIDFMWSQDSNMISVTNFVETRTFVLAGNTLTVVEENGLEIPEIVDAGFGGLFSVDYNFEDATYTYTKQ